MSMLDGDQNEEEAIRCTSCNKLVAKNLARGHLQIKCSRCGSFNEIFEKMIEHVAIANANGEIIFANKALEHETGFTIDESLGRKPSELWGGHMSPEFYAGMWKVLREEKKVFHSVLQNVKKTGELYSVEVAISPIFDALGDPMFYICIGTVVPGDS